MKKIWMLVLTIGLLSTTYAQVKIDRAKKPKAGPAPEIKFKDPVIFNMPNGMTVLVVEDHKLPKVSANLSIDAGPIKEGEKAGVIGLMGEMLGEGTKNMSKAKFDETVDGMGANLNLYGSGASANSLTRYFEKTVMLMADALRNPLLSQESFEKIKTQTITGLKTSEKSAPTIAARVNNALHYGKETAFGEFETEETVKGLQLADVKEAYTNYISPSRSYLTIIGDITPANAKILAQKAFGSWTGKKLTLPNIVVAKNPEVSEIAIVNLPTAVQGELRVGNVIYNPMSNPDYHALLLANQIFGGSSESKLFSNLREKHGFTYGSYSSVGSGRFQDLFTASAAVRTDKIDSAVAEMFAEILNMRDGKIEAKELELAKAKFNGAFALKMESPGTAATYASNILINNLPKDFYRTFLQKINAVTIADLKRVSQKYFNESNSRIVIVGNAKVIAPKLARLGFPIKEYDKYANLVEKKAESDVKDSPATSDAVSADFVLEKYLKAIGGKENLKKVNSLNATFALEMMGRELSGVDKRMSGAKSFMVIKMGDMAVMTRAFDGTSGYAAQMGNKKELSLEEIKEAKDEKGIFPQLYFNDADTKTEYVGAGKVGDEATYRLKVVYPSGRESLQEYSAKSGLLLSEETASSQGGQLVPLNVVYKDYRKVGDVMLPFSITREVGGQEFTIKYVDIKLNEGVTESDFK